MSRGPGAFGRHRPHEPSALTADGEVRPEGAPAVGLRYRGFGSSVPGRPPIVVLPGLGVSRYLRAGCAVLAQRSGHRVLLVDPPGFGTNSRAVEGPVTVSAVTRRLEDWLRPRGPVLLVGQSTGCLLAAALARAEGEVRVDVRAVALVGPVFDPARATLPQAALRLVLDGTHEPWWLGPSQVPEWLRNARVLPRYLRSCLAESLAAHVALTSCEVLVVRGDRDPLSRPDWVAHLAAGPRRRLVTVPRGGHTFMVGRPLLLAKSLETGGFA